MEALSNELIHQWHEAVENLDGYRPGGYHPTHNEDLYSNGRYEIVHKLSFGSCSTVWLARDLHLNRYVALIIGSKEVSRKWMFPLEIARAIGA